MSYELKNQINDIYKTINKINIDNKANGYSELNNPHYDKYNNEDYLYSSHDGCMNINMYSGAPSPPAGFYGIINIYTACHAPGIVKY